MVSPVPGNCANGIEFRQQSRRFVFNAEREQVDEKTGESDAGNDGRQTVLMVTLGFANCQSLVFASPAG
jgi:hypothetical protein